MFSILESHVTDCKRGPKDVNSSQTHKKGPPEVHMIKPPVRIINTLAAETVCCNMALKYMMLTGQKGEGVRSTQGAWLES
jgi:hypothetical protein